MNLSVVLISNPVAKKASARRVAMASYYLQSKGYRVETLFTEKKGDAESLAREAIKKSPSLIIAAGGDGTFNEVINGIAGSEIPMGILPLGTTNVLAKELGIPENVEGALEIAVRKAPKIVSLGKIVRNSEFKNPPSPPLSALRRIPASGGSPFISRYFVLMAGVGFDGEAVFGINETIKQISGKGAYIYSGIVTLLKFNPVELPFNIDGKTYSGYSAIIGKASKYGGNFRITPDARLTEPSFYICLFKGKKRSDIVRYAFGIVTGNHLRFNDIEYLKAERVEINGSAHIQIDGDYLGMTPAKVEVVPNILRLIY